MYVQVWVCVCVCMGMCVDMCVGVCGYVGMGIYVYDLEGEEPVDIGGGGRE